MNNNNSTITIKICQKYIIRKIINIIIMYAQKSFKERLTSLDIYKQLPKGYLQPTCIGAIRKKRINNLKQI